MKSKQSPVREQINLLQRIKIHADDFALIGSSKQQLERFVTKIQDHAKLCGRQTVPLGDLQGVGQCCLSLECLFIKKTLDGVVGQLFHDKKGFAEVQQHGEIMIISMS